MQSHHTLENIKNIERKIFFKYKYHLATIFFTCLIFAFGGWRGIAALLYMEQQAITIQTIKNANDWEKIDSSLKKEIQKKKIECC